jgi:hypothetical protein
VATVGLSGAEILACTAVAAAGENGWLAEPCGAAHLSRAAMSAACHHTLGPVPRQRAMKFVYKALSLFVSAATLLARRRPADAMKT